MWNLKSVTLCGSTKFKNGYEHWNRQLSLAGGVVYSVATYGHQPGQELTMQEKALLDVVHLSKIERSDIVFVIVGDDPTPSERYIGESTSREIEFARASGKQVFYSDDPGDILNILGDRSKSF